jgi:hypothetical protein
MVNTIASGGVMSIPLFCKHLWQMYPAEPWQLIVSEVERGAGAKILRILLGQKPPPFDGASVIVNAGEILPALPFGYAREVSGKCSASANGHPQW